MKYYQIYGARTGLHKHAHIYIHVKLNLRGIRTTFDWTYIRDHGIDFQVILLCSCRNYDLKIFMSFFNSFAINFQFALWSVKREKNNEREQKKIILKTMFTIIMLEGRRIILPMVSASAKNLSVVWILMFGIAKFSSVSHLMRVFKGSNQKRDDKMCRKRNR